MTIEKATGYTSNGEDFHVTLEGAQLAALEDLFNKDENASDEQCKALAAFALEHSEQLIEILQIKVKGRPRKNAGVVKPRKAKLATAPLSEKGAE